MKLRLLALVTTLFVSAQGFAGLLIDPYIGIGSSVGSAEFSGLTVADPDDESTQSVGSRLGYSFLLFSAGIDYEMVTSGDDKLTNTSAFVGVDLPVLLRFWAEYMLSSKFEDDDDQDYDFKDGYGLGIGFTGLPFVSLNLELQNLNYDTTVNVLGTDFDGTLGITTTTFSVSFPLDF